MKPQKKIVKAWAMLKRGKIIGMSFEKPKDTYESCYDYSNIVPCEIHYKLPNK